MTDTIKSKVYPWNESLDRCAAFEEHNSDYILSFPQLTTADVDELVNRWADKRFYCALTLLGNLLGDASTTSKRATLKTLLYLKRVDQLNARAAAGLVFAPNLTFSMLRDIWETWGTNGEVRHHIVGVICSKFSNKPAALKLLKTLYDMEDDEYTRRYIEEFWRRERS